MSENIFDFIDFLPGVVETELPGLRMSYVREINELDDLEARISLVTWRVYIFTIKINKLLRDNWEQKDIEAAKSAF